MFRFSVRLLVKMKLHGIMIKPVFFLNILIFHQLRSNTRAYSFSLYVIHFYFYNSLLHSGLTHFLLYNLIKRQYFFILNKSQFNLKNHKYFIKLFLHYFSLKFLIYFPLSGFCELIRSIFFY